MLASAVGLPPAVAESCVSLSDNVAGVILRNVLLTATVRKRDGRIIELIPRGGPNLVGNSDGRFIYFDTNGSKGGKSHYLGFEPTDFGIVTQTAERVEIKLAQPDLGGFGVEMHYIMRGSDSGIYLYAVLRHGPGMPAINIGQARWVIRCDSAVITHAFSSEGRKGRVFRPDQRDETIMDATTKLAASNGYQEETGLTSDRRPVYTKYDWADYLEHHLAHGLAGDIRGVWMLTGSMEYCNGGPTKANLFVHNGHSQSVLAGRSG